MLLTDRFTYIHMPKTGGTFVTFVLEELHGVPRSRWGKRLAALARKLHAPARAARYGPLFNVAPTHGTCSDIPAKHAGKPILSTIRGPYEWYVSQYEFGWWRRTSEYDPKGPPTPAGWAIEQALPQFVAAHPAFPDISFEEFMQLCTAAADIYNRELGTDSGLHTHGFVRYFCRRPETVLRQLAAGHLTWEEHRYPVRFIRTEHLKEELVEALTSFGYRGEDLAFIERLGRILPMGIGRRPDQQWQLNYTPALARLVRRRDDPLFRIFPDYDVEPTGSGTAAAAS